MRLLTPLALLALAACGGGDKPTDSGTTTPAGTATAVTGTATGTATGTGTGTATGSSTPPPTAVDDPVAIDEGGNAFVDVIANDSSPVGLSPLSVTLRSYPMYGTLLVQADGIGYQHDGSETTSDSFTYTVDDTLGQTSNEAQVAISIAPVNDPPLAADDASIVDEGGFVQIDLAGNDTDVDDAVDPATIAIVGQPGAGTVLVNANGTVDYTHDGSESPMDGFTYQISDTVGDPSNTAVVAITVRPVNDPPTAVDDVGFCLTGGVTVINLPANDSDPDDGLDRSTVTVVVPPLAGTVVIDPVDGSVEYTHDGGVAVYDSFTYTIADNSGAVSAPATVSLTISYTAPPAIVGSFLVEDGPIWTTNPPVYSCLDACALLFGGLAGDYQCSSTGLSIDNQAWSSTYAVPGCAQIAEDFSTDLGGGYDCGIAGCATSAYVADSCNYGMRNFCWQ